MSEDSQQDGLPIPRRYWAVAAISLAVMMMVLDSSIANIALPTIARDLGATPAEIIWVINAYQIATFVSLLPLAALAESRGYRPVYLCGLALFIIASFACTFAGSINGLILARVAQGLGAAGVLCINAALMRFCYPVRLLHFGIAFGTTVVAVSSAFGPSLGAFLLSLGNWRLLFGVNVPIGLAVIVIAWLSLPHPPTSKRAFDFISALLNATMLGLLMVGVDTFSRGEQFAGLALAELAAAAIAGVILVRRSLRQTQPLVPLDLFRIRMYALSIGTSLTAFTAEAMAMVSLPFILHYGMGRTTIETGLLLMPWPIAVAISAQLAGHLTRRFSSGALGGAGLLALAMGLGLLAATSHEVGNFDLVWRVALCGAGFGFFQTPNNHAILLSVPRLRSGAATGTASTARLVGQTTGAMIVALTFRWFPNNVGSTLPLMIAAVIAVGAAVVSGLRVTTPRID